MSIEVTILNNGPYMVAGDLAGLTLKDGGGNVHDLSGKKQVYLCRCGGSTNKPFCDGQHSKIGFQAAEAAVKAEG